MLRDVNLVPTTESDRTYIARLSFLTDVFGDEKAPTSPTFDDDYEFYVNRWKAENGGFIAWKGFIPAGGVWLLWGNDELHGYGYVEEGIPELAIAVEARFKGSGYGTRLLDAATELARELGAPGISRGVETSNWRALRLYEHVGFEKVSEDRGDLVMVKRF